MDHPPAPNILTYDSSSIVFALDWSSRQDKGVRVAVGSFVEGVSNTVEILRVTPAGLILDEKETFGIEYPATQVGFIPDRFCNKPDLLATSGDAVRLWKISDAGTTLELVLNDPKNTSKNFSAVTCFDWSEINVKVLAAGSSAGRLLLWDTESGRLQGTMVGHEDEILDCQWAANDVIVSSSGDGSIRMYDLRDKDHCTVLYETPRRTPVPSFCWNKLDPKYLAFSIEKSRLVSVLDVRFPTEPVILLDGHMGNCTALGWSPHREGYLCSVGDDCHALIWDMGKVNSEEDSKPNREAVDASPILAYNAQAEINAMAWNPIDPDWIAICARNRTRVLRI
ncbi:WD repeat-containing protein LWD2 [Picochlorum sp. SENEW3]|nr:WD repeat-containing protein LWD2 [Picochlorum sp. SENEW3]WPT17444.1 WD repeat-containing protein LWD2 [Picochlorum sp. SENEW3]